MMDYDVVIIGGGLAGITLALSLEDKFKIALICKTNLKESSSIRAQGGIAAVLNKNDDVDSHVRDTLIAGAGICDQENVEKIISQGKNSIDWLIQQKVNFTQYDDQLHLTREGGHSHRRIVHAEDKTGLEVMTSLSKILKNKKNVHIMNNTIVSKILYTGSIEKKINGVELFFCAEDKKKTINCQYVVIATGGIGQLYKNTTNPQTATGDGIALGFDVGCYIANLEFIQFHPTALYKPHMETFLISEAVRGEGGKLLNINYERFMHKYDERMELAPRDIVARAILSEMMLSTSSYVYLDITHKPKDFIQSHFPCIYHKCLDVGIDISKEYIPISPAAHYSCGGILVDTNGKTNIQNLFAIGEVANTGLHGANRLASNSLLECIAMGRNLAQCINFNDLEPLNIDEKIFTIKKININFANTKNITDYRSSKITLDQLKNDLQNIMSKNISIIRNYLGLLDTLDQLNHMKVLLKDISNEIFLDYYEVKNLITCAQILVNSALLRKSSVGSHFIEDSYKRQCNDFKNILISHLSSI